MRRIGVLVLVVFTLLGSMSLTAESQQSASEARDQRDQVRKDKEDAARELDTAKAEDEEVYAALLAITSVVNAQQADIDEANRQLESFRSQADVAAEAIVAAEAEQERLAAELSAMAVAGFVNAGEQPPVLFESDDINEALRQTALLDQANGDTADLLEQMRVVQEDRDLAELAAREAVAEAERLENELAMELVELESQQAVQAELKAELERRVADWQSKLTELEADDRELTAFIQAEEAKARAAEAAAAAAANGGSTAPAPGSSSASGFQWPVRGSVSSGFGYRIHPIYGTRRLHTGLDISGGFGTPIAAAKGGTVIDARYRGGYGNAVVISHGGGITTLYAHQSTMNVSSGQQVSKGDIIGWVGSTGASTGPHLHFEVRVNGSPVNPRPYLP